MNVFSHFKITRQRLGTLLATLSILPDVFVLIRKIFPFYPIEDICRRCHNTEESVHRISRVSNRLGLAWEEHRRLDMTTHDYAYDFNDKIPANSVLLLSGGLDSFIQWRLLGMPQAIHFLIGNRAEYKELEMIKKISDDFDADIHMVKLDLAKFEFDNGYIPFRNLLFIVIASLYSPNVVLCQVSEWAPDKNIQFYKKTEKLLAEIGRGSFQGINIKPRIYAPFHRYTKTNLVSEYIKKYSADELFRYTVSCYSNNKLLPCGKCSACITRYIAMTNNGIHEDYEHVPEPGITKSKLSIRDFSVTRIPMYIRRLHEYRTFRRRPSEIR